MIQPAYACLMEEGTVDQLGHPLVLTIGVAGGGQYHSLIGRASRLPL